EWSRAVHRRAGDRHYAEPLSGRQIQSIGDWIKHGVYHFVVGHLTFELLSRRRAVGSYLNNDLRRSRGAGQKHDRSDGQQTSFDIHFQPPWSRSPDYYAGRKSKPVRRAKFFMRSPLMNMTSRDTS